MTKNNDVFAKIADTVGDLGSPFYAEERQRDVWNEASAVGFQALLWGALVVAAAMTWIGGAEQVPWAIVLLLVVAAASWFTILHARRHGVSGLEDVRVAGPRLALFLALYVVTLAGMLVRSAGDLPSGFVAGATGGLIVGVLAALVAVIRGSRVGREP